MASLCYYTRTAELASGSFIKHSLSFVSDRLLAFARSDTPTRANQALLTTSRLGDNGEIITKPNTIKVSDLSQTDRRHQRSADHYTQLLWTAHIRGSSTTFEAHCGITKVTLFTFPMSFRRGRDKDGTQVWGACRTIVGGHMYEKNEPRWGAAGARKCPPNVL